MNFTDKKLELKLGGYSPDELKQIESKWKIKFPKKFSEILMKYKIQNKGFIDWLNDDEVLIFNKLNEPLLGLLESIENGFWLKKWGPCKSIEKNIMHIKKLLGEAPRLIPLHRNKYLMPTQDGEVNPVFSIVGHDIIIYSSSINTYLSSNFIDCPDHIKNESKNIIEKNVPFISFWSNFL